MPTANNKWVKYLRTQEAGLTLFCFPFSGAGALAYRGWERKFPSTIDVAAIRLPGRETRFSEPPFTALGPLMGTLGEAVAPHLNGAFAFFGHSLGGLLCFELTRWLSANGLPVPNHLFVSAFRAPHYPHRTRALHNLPHAALINELTALNGTPLALIENPELLDLYLPTLRADLEICETYRHVPGAPLDIPITVFAGRDDPHVSPYELAGWHDHTTRRFSLHVLEGDHFYINSAECARVFDEIARTIEVLSPKDGLHK